jgi:peroxiredoxin
MAARLSLLLAACLCGWIEPPAGALDTATSQVAIEERYDALAHEFASIRDALVAAKAADAAAGEPRWLRLAFRAQMSELADAGSPRALAWLAAHFAVEPAQEKDAAALEGDLFERLLPSFANEPWLADRETDVVTALALAADEIGFERAAQLESSIYAATPSADLRSRALMAQAHILAPPNCGDRERRGRAVALLRGELAQHPGHSLARQCNDAIWRLEHLAPNLVAPDFGARDVDGNELRLSDWRGKIVLVDVWSFGRPECTSRLAGRQALVDRHPSDPFVLFGVDLDRDELAFRRAWEEHDLRFPCAFEGGPSGRVQSAWHLDGAPTSFLIDRAGVIRAVDLDGDALDAAVAALLAEPPTEAAALGPPQQRR